METLREKIAEFLKVNFGYGFGFGSGSGSDNGSGFGNDFGSGFGSGFGFGSGTGSGSGFGNGFGSGNGNDFGFGKEFKGYPIYYIDNVPTLIFAVRANIAEGATLIDDFTLHSCYIAKEGNYFAHGSTAREALNAANAKALQGEPISTRIERFVTSFPDFDAEIPAQTLFEWHHILTGSCEFGRRQFAENHNINLGADSFTVKEFVELTKDEYGGDNIKLILKHKQQ